jgi:hypothetical protein
MTPPITLHLRRDEDERRLAAEEGRAVAADLLADPGLCRWAELTRRAVRVDRRPWRSPLHPPHDGAPAECGAWYGEHYLPRRAGLRRLLPGLRGKVLIAEGTYAGAHSAALAEAANGVFRPVRADVPARASVPVSAP